MLVIEFAWQDDCGAGAFGVRHQVEMLNQIGNEHPLAPNLHIGVLQIRRKAEAGIGNVERIGFSANSTVIVTRV